MSTSVLLTSIAIAWLLYPVAGAISVAAAVEKGTRPQGAGFSFLPELITFPAAFYGVAFVIDIFIQPWGSWLVVGACAAMVITSIISILFNIRILRRVRNEAT